MHSQYPTKVTATLRSALNSEKDILSLESGCFATDEVEVISTKDGEKRTR